MTLAIILSAWSADRISVRRVVYPSRLTLKRLADLVAYATFLRFERGDNRYYKVIENCFDAEGGVVHGLYSR